MSECYCLYLIVSVDVALLHIFCVVDVRKNVFISCTCISLFLQRMSYNDNNNNNSHFQEYCLLNGVFYAKIYGCQFCLVNDTLGL